MAATGVRAGSTVAGGAGPQVVRSRPMAEPEGAVACGVSPQCYPASTLRRGEGIEDVVARRDISSLTSMGLPLMPEGLEIEFEPAEMADLLRFIQAQARQSR